MAVIVNVPLQAMQALAVCIGAEVGGPAQARSDGGTLVECEPHTTGRSLIRHAMSILLSPGGDGRGVCRSQERGLLQEL